MSGTTEASSIADGERLVFIVGAPRSGTTWLQRLMGAHPEIVTTQETELIDKYCKPWYDAWDEQLPPDAETWRRHRHRGLPAVLTTEEMEEQVRGFARLVYARILDLKPGAHVVIDKNPDYARHTGVIRRTFAGAGILHIVRDGRDVASSMLAASGGWGRDWAPRSLRLAASTWRANVEAAMTASTTGRYLQVSYEDLRAETAATLQQCLAFAGVRASARESEEIADRLDRAAGGNDVDPLVWSGEVMRRLGEPPVEPEGFFGTGSSRGWKDTWSTRDRVGFEVAAGGLLRDLGYVAGPDWTGAPLLRRLQAAQYARASDLVTRLGWALHMRLGRRGWYVHVARIAPYS